MARVSQGDTFEWFDGQRVEIEYVKDDGTVYFSDDEGNHKCSMDTFMVAVEQDERYACMERTSEKDSGGLLFA